MTGAFLYLTACSIKNSLRVRLRRLRQPRYLIGTAAGVLYFYFFIFGGMRVGRGGAGPPSPGAILSRLGLSLEFLGAMLLLLFAALAWVWPGSRGALTFSRADIQFLFPAPATRRQLLHYKLLRAQIGAVVGSAFVALVFRPGAAATNLRFWLGLWLVSTAMSLYFIAVSFTRESLTRHGSRGWLRQRVPIAVVGLVVVALAVAILPAWPRLAAMANGREVLAELQRLTSAGPAAIVLWPFRALVQVPLSASAAALWAALPPALLVLVAAYVWVMRADTAFEEASAEQAERVARRPPGRAQPVVRKRAAGAFRLAPIGSTETAILWKNLTLIGRYLSLRLLWRLLPLVVVFAVVLTRPSRPGEGITELLGVLCFVFAIMALFIGPQVARNDLRQDLAYLATLKTWPVRGAPLLRGEVLASTTVLFAVLTLFIALAAVLLRDPPGLRGASVLVRVEYATAAVILAGGVALVQLVIQNGFAVLFPAWIATGPQRPRGIEAMGQQLVLMLGSILALVVALLPAALVTAAVAFALQAVFGRVFVIPVAVAATAALAAEAWIATEVLGLVIDRTDVSAVDAPT